MAAPPPPIEIAVAAAPIILPDWLGVASILPTPNEWKAQSSVTGHIRSRSQIVHVDAALEAFWGALDVCRAKGVRTSTVDASETKRALGALVAAADAYLAHETGIATDQLALAFQSGDVGAVGVARSQLRTALEAVIARGKQRVPAAMSLRRLASLEVTRFKPWVQGAPPGADPMQAWGGITYLPTLEIWKLESSGGPDKAWTLRRRSTITAVDAALEKWWKAFLWAQKSQSNDALTELIQKCDVYLQHKKETEHGTARVDACVRLKFRAQKEQERLRGWQELLPPLVKATDPLGPDFDPFASGTGFLELRTLVPTTEVWKVRSSESGAIRRMSEVVVLVDLKVAAFWAAFAAKGQDPHALEAHGDPDGLPPLT